MPLSPVSGGQTVLERDELLGSLTTEQQQRTSARVIKKLRLDDAAADRDKKELFECEQKLKEEDKDLPKLTVKQRMPKVWSADEKNLFFEALNEYGKDFDAITAYICAKLKKKGITDLANLKTKSQVAHFYYRTWHKLSKHVHFDENVKKLAQELYALINYGELRRKLSSVNEKTCSRLGEMVTTGSLVVRVKGKNVRLRTPMCRALRRLNQITERGCWWWGRGGRVSVSLVPSGAGSWCRVQSAGHNPRVLLPAPPSTSLHQLIDALARRWTPVHNTDSLGSKTCKPSGDDTYLNFETDKTIIGEVNQCKRPALHVGPRPNVSVHLPTLTASEHMSTQKICLTSYLERVYRDKDLQPKIRTPKRQRKDSATEKDCDSKKFKCDENDGKLDMIDDMAIDGIELMANYKYNIDQNDDDDKNYTEDEREQKTEHAADQEQSDAAKEGPEAGIENDSEYKETADASEKEMSFSEMEDKSDSDNENDCKEKTSLKIKFRIRSKKRGGSIYTLVEENQTINEKLPEDANKTSEEIIHAKTASESGKGPTPSESQANPEKITEDPIRSQDDQVKSHDDQVKSQDEHAKVQENPVKVQDKPSKVLENQTKEDQIKIGDELSKGELKNHVEQEKSDVDVEFAIRQIRKGWSVYDAGNLTIGDLYLMFGSKSKIQLEYWWAEPTPPLVRPNRHIQRPKNLSIDKKDTMDRTPEKSGRASEEEREKRDSDNDILSPKNAFGQDSNDGLSGDERKYELFASPEHKGMSTVCSGTLELTSKLVNRPDPPPSNSQVSLMSNRLKRLLSLVGNQFSPMSPPTARKNTDCDCGHVCAARKKKNESVASPREEPSPVFLHPRPIAPKPTTENRRDVPWSEMPPLPPLGRRGRSRGEQRVVVQRLLPLLPKLPQHNLIPIKLVPQAPAPLPRIRPKPEKMEVASSEVTSTSTSNIYVLSEQNGQFFYHEGDMKIPLEQFMGSGNNKTEEVDIDEKGNVQTVETRDNIMTSTAEGISANVDQTDSVAVCNSDGSLLKNEDSADINCILRNDAGIYPWLDAGHDFSLSSFLNHLDRPNSPPQLDSQLQSVFAESSIDYVAKFADLNAEVTDVGDDLKTDE